MKHIYYLAFIISATILGFQGLGVWKSENELAAVNALVANDPTGAPAVYTDAERSDMDNLFAQLAEAE